MRGIKQGPALAGGAAGAKFAIRNSLQWRRQHKRGGNLFPAQVRTAVLRTLNYPAAQPDVVAAADALASREGDRSAMDLRASLTILAFALTIAELGLEIVKLHKDAGKLTSRDDLTTQIALRLSERKFVAITLGPDRHDEVLNRILRDA